MEQRNYKLRISISHCKLPKRGNEYILQQAVDKAITQSLKENNVPSEISQIISSMNCVQCIDSLRNQKKCRECAEILCEGYQLGLTYVCYKCDDWRHQNHSLLEVD